MYFDIALHYHATINVRQHEQPKDPEKGIRTVPHRLPSHTGFGMLTAKVAVAGSGQPWVPHGDKAAQPRSSHRLNA